jgi:hypothetical protein
MEKQADSAWRLDCVFAAPLQCIGYGIAVPLLRH